MTERQSGIWGSLGLTPEEIESVYKATEKVDRAKDARVCICGHGATRHKQAYGVSRCQPGRQSCSCAQLQVVLHASDLRSFMCRTTGPGAEHALVKGIAGSERLAEKTGIPLEIDWVVEVKCQRCGSEDGVVPAAITSGGFVSDGPERLNVLSCRKCLEELSRFS